MEIKLVKSKVGTMMTHYEVDDQNLSGKIYVPNEMANESISEIIIDFPVKETVIAQ